MPSMKNAKTRTQPSRATGARTRSNGPGTAGDIPKRQKVDYVTSSVRVPRATGQMSVRQIAPLQTIIAVAGSAVNPVINFALNGIGGSSTFVSLFDQYRIDAIKCTVRANNNALDLRNPTVDALVPLYWVIDYNDSVALTSTNAALEYDNCMILGPGESASRTICPKYSLAVRSGSGSDYIAGTGAWLATASDDIFHYGFKFYAPALPAIQSNLQTWLVEIEYYLTFRQVA